MQRRYFRPLEVELPLEGQDDTARVKILHNASPRPPAYVVTPAGPWRKIRNPMLLHLVYNAANEKFVGGVESTDGATTPLYRARESARGFLAALLDFFRLRWILRILGDR